MNRIPLCHGLVNYAQPTAGSCRQSSERSSLPPFASQWLPSDFSSSASSQPPTFDRSCFHCQPSKSTKRGCNKSTAPTPYGHAPITGPAGRSPRSSKPRGSALRPHVHEMSEYLSRRQSQLFWSTKPSDVIVFLLNCFTVTHSTYLFSNALFVAFIPHLLLNNASILNLTRSNPKNPTTPTSLPPPTCPSNNRNQGGVSEAVAPAAIVVEGPAHRQIEPALRDPAVEIPSDQRRKISSI